MLLFTVTSPLSQPLLHPRHLPHQWIPCPSILPAKLHSSSAPSHPHSGRIPRPTPILRSHSLCDCERGWQRCSFLRGGELGGALEGSIATGKIEDTVVEHRWADDPPVRLPLSTCPSRPRLQGHELLLQVLLWAIGPEEPDQRGYPDVCICANALSRQEDRAVPGWLGSPAVHLVPGGEDDVEQLLPNAQIEEPSEDALWNAADIHTQESDHLNSRTYFPLNGRLLCREEPGTDHIETGANQ